MAGIDNSAILLKSDYQFKGWSDHEHPALPCQKDKRAALMQSPSRRVRGFFIKYIYFFREKQVRTFLLDTFTRKAPRDFRSIADQERKFVSQQSIDKRSMARNGNNVQTIYRRVISQSDGSALSACWIRKDKFQRNSLSANKIETAVIMQMDTPPSHRSQFPLCVSLGAGH